MTGPLNATGRTRLRRLPGNASFDRDALYALLDEALVAHVGLVEQGQPFVLPTAYVRDGDSLLLHGSTGSRLFRRMASGAPVCATVTVVDGVVYARSVFNSSMNYRSAVLLGAGVRVPEGEKAEALAVLADRLTPGHRADARPPTRREIAATMVVRLPLDEVSLKVSSGLPDTEPEDAGWPAWAGVVPVCQIFGQAMSRDTRPTPEYLRRPQPAAYGVHAW